VGATQSFYRRLREKARSVISHSNEQSESSEREGKTSDSLALRITTADGDLHKNELLQSKLPLRDHRAQYNGLTSDICR
jgi:hypothetical protein